jgi:hypothetical protein
MRNKKVAFLSCAVVAAIGLLATPAAMATGSSCSSFNPTVTVLQGPCPLNTSTPTPTTACATSGGYTGIQYAITGSPSTISTVVTSNNTLVRQPNSSVFAECVGDSETGLGKQSCHEKAIRYSCAANTTTFWVVVEGTKAATLQTVAAKKNSCTRSVAVPGLGFDVNVFQASQKTETVNFKGCAVVFQYDTLTGAVQSATLTPESLAAGCESPNQPTPGAAALEGKPAQDLELTLKVGATAISLGEGQFGEGYVSSGTNSCTTRIIGGRVYTWGNPCPD